MMKVQGVVLECGIVVFELLRNLLFDVCVNCGVGLIEAVWKVSNVSNCGVGPWMCQWNVMMWHW